MTFNDFVIQSAERGIREFGLAKIAGALAGLVAVLGGLGFMWSAKATLAIMSGGLLVWTLLVLLAALADRRALYRRISDHRHVLTRYAHEIQTRQVPTAFTIESWQEDISIDRRGDTDISRRLTLNIGSSDLEAFWTLVKMDPAPENSAYKKRVKVTAGLLDPQGGKIRVPVVTEWHGHRLTIYIHMLQPQPAYSTLDLFVSLKWPGYYGRLGEGEAVPTDWTLRRQVNSLKATMHLSKHILNGRRLAVTAFGSGSPHPIVTQGPPGMIQWEATSLAAGSHVGFNVQLEV